MYTYLNTYYMSVLPESLEYDFFESALAGLIKSLEVMIEPFAKKVDAVVPIYIPNTGDEVYLSNMKGDGVTTTDTVYSSVPRLAINLPESSMIISTDEFTSRHASGFFDIKHEEGYNSEYRAPVRRMPIQYAVTVKCVFSNIHEYFMFLNMYLNYSYKDIVYRFSYLGHTQEASWEVPESFDTNMNQELSFDTQKRNVELDLPIVIAMQMPVYNLGKAQYRGNTMNNIKLNAHVDDNLVETIETNTAD